MVRWCGWNFWVWWILENIVGVGRWLSSLYSPFIFIYFSLQCVFEERLCLLWKERGRETVCMSGRLRRRCLGFLVRILLCVRVYSIYRERCGEEEVGELRNKVTQTKQRCYFEAWYIKRKYC